jgi:hypothetical protein
MMAIGDPTGAFPQRGTTSTGRLDFVPGGYDRLGYYHRKDDSYEERRKEAQSSMGPNLYQRWVRDNSPGGPGSPQQQNPGAGGGNVNALAHATILGDLTAGRITAAQAEERLRLIGVSSDMIRQEIQAATRAQPAQGNVPTAPVGSVAPPTSTTPGSALTGPPPWSESEGERGIAFNAFLGDRFGAGVPTYLQRPLQRMFEPLQQAYTFGTDFGTVPGGTSFAQFAKQGQGLPDFRGLAERGANAFSGGDDVLQSRLAEDQERQFDLSLLAAGQNVPWTLKNALQNVGRRRFDQWQVGLPQGDAAAGVSASNLNWLPEFARRGFRF